jgi:transcriptional regulator with XRE-family HTH domain
MTDIERIDHIRQSAGLTITEFAAILPIHRSTYYDWLSGRTTPDPIRLKECLRLTSIADSLLHQDLLPLSRGDYKRGRNLAALTQLFFE